MKKKILLLILSIITALCAVFFIACNEKAIDNRDKDILSVYNAYVAYAEEKGDTVLSYEEWLKSIKGEKGDRGERGKSAYEIWLDNGYEGTEIDFLNWLKNGAPAVEPENPDEPQEPENPSETVLSKINKDTNFEALESDKVTKEELFNAIIEVEEILYCYDFEINVTLEGVQIDREGKAYTGFIKRDGLYVLNSNNLQKPEYIVISKDHKSYVNNGQMYDSAERRKEYCGEEYQSSIRQSLEYDSISYNDISKRYEVVQTDNSAYTNYFIMKDGHVVYAHSEADNEGSMTFKLYDWGTTKVILPDTNVQSGEYVDNTTRNKIIKAIDGLLRMYDYLEGNGTMKNNLYGDIEYQDVNNGKAVCYNNEDIFCYLAIIDEENCIMHIVDPYYENDYTPWNIQDAINNMLIDCFNISYEAIMDQAKIYFTERENEYACIVDDKIFIVTLNNDGKAIKFATEDDSSYLSVECFGGISVNLPQEFIDVINEYKNNL